MFYQKTVLTNGITVMSEKVAGFRSVTLGLWVGVGSRDETPEQGGISHFMEHMLFKGTPTRTAEDLNIAFDQIGAENNAFTSKECTCFYARFIDEHLERAFELLGDMLVNSTFEQGCIDSEREVVIEEIARSEDTPEDYVFDLATAAAWPDDALGRPILGTRPVVGAFDHDDCVAYHDARYTTGNLVVAASGNVDHGQLVELAERYLSGLPDCTRTVRPAVTCDSRRRFSVMKKETEQAHIVYTLPGLPLDDPERWAATLLDTVLGSGMSSRLFQEVREKRGLAYAVSSYSSSYQGTGIYSVYAGTRPANLEKVVDIIHRELAKALEEGITAEELARAKETVASQIVLRGEYTQTRMGALGRNEVLGCELLSIDDQERRVRAVSLDDVAKVAPRLLTGTPTISVISPFEPDDVEARLSSVVGE